MEKKYELVKDEKYPAFYRVKALISFNGVRLGSLGGLVSGEHNLSQSGNCWIYNNAIVCGNARVIDNAKVKDDAKVYCNAIICDNARVIDNAIIRNSAIIKGDSKIIEHTIVGGNSIISCKDTILANHINDAEINSCYDLFSFNINSLSLSVTWTRKENKYSIEMYSFTEEKFKKYLVERSLKAMSEFITIKECIDKYKESFE